MSEQTSLLVQLQTIRDFIRYAMSEFNAAQIYYGHGTDNALDEATTLVLHVLHLPHDLPGNFMGSQLLLSEKQAILKLIARRIQERVPLPYLIKDAWFAGVQFYVDERVLIPRSPLAEIIEQQFEPWVDVSRVKNILDLCTGSGCIAIACAYAFPEADVDASDVSEGALAVAEINVERHALSERVNLIHSDLYNNLIDKHYDIIVTNPPYVDQAELAGMPKEYFHEPVLGLAAGTDGLSLITPLLQQAKKFLKPEGVLIAEVGASQNAMMERFPDIPLLWLDFEHGGEGVFIITKAQLDECF